MDYIFIENLKIAGRHGVMEHERHVEQEFEISATMECDTAQAAGSDDLADALDYAPVREKIVKIVQGNSFYLIEKLGETICQEILKDARIRSVELTIRKPEVWDNGTPGLRMTRINA